MKHNAATAAKVIRLRKQRNKARHALRLMKSARDNVQAQLARERRGWEQQRQEGQEANQRQAGTIQALRADARQARYDYQQADRQLGAAAKALTALLGDLSELDSLHDIRQRIEAVATLVRQPQPSDHHHHVHVSMGVTSEAEPQETADALREALEARTSTEPRPRFGGILPTDLLAERRPQRTYESDIDPQPSVHDASSTDRLNWFARKAQLTELLDLLEAAWGIIANAGPTEEGPPTATPGWSEAALRFREQYHDLLGRLFPPRPFASDHHTHIHVSMGKVAAKGSPEEVAASVHAAIENVLGQATSPHAAAQALAAELEKRASGAASFSAGTSMVEPARTEEELEDELLDARAAQAMAEYQERTGMTPEEVAAQTARGLLDAIDQPLADSTPEEVAALAALADTLAPLRAYEPMSQPAGIVTQDRETGQVVDDTSAAYEARIAPTGETTSAAYEARIAPTGETTGAPAGFAYTPGSEAAKAAMAEEGITDLAAAQAAEEAALKAGERRCSNPEAHLGHDWWDDQSTARLTWFCPGMSFPEEADEPRYNESWDEMMERHAAFAAASDAPTPSIGTDAMEDAIQSAVQAGTWTEGTFTVADTDGSTATYAWDGAEPISTTPPTLPRIEVEPERYEALLHYLREELDAEEPVADANDILVALGLYVDLAAAQAAAEPTDLEKLRSVAPPAGPVDRLVHDVLAHAKGGINNPGDWFLAAASMFYPELGTFRSSERDHIWELAAELARERAQADYDETVSQLARAAENLTLAAARVATLRQAEATASQTLTQLGAPAE